MSRIHQYVNPYDKHRIDFIQTLPPTATPLRTYKGDRLRHIYWYDSETNRIIKRNEKKATYPFRYYRTSEIVLQLDNYDVVHVKLEELLNSIEECFPSPEEIEDMLLINSI